MVGRRKLKDVLGPLRVREIEEAALRVVARKGLDGTTMQEIADEAGIAKGTLYLYFDSRDDLIFHLAEAAFEDLHASVAEAISLGESAGERLGAAIRTHVAFFERRRDLFRLFLGVAHPGSDPAPASRLRRTCHPIYLAYLDLLAGLLSGAQARGEVRPLRPDRLALFIAEGIAGVILRRLGESDPPPVEDDIRLLVEVVSGGVLLRRTA